MTEMYKYYTRRGNTFFFRNVETNEKLALDVKEDDLWNMEMNILLRDGYVMIFPQYLMN